MAGANAARGDSKLVDQKLKALETTMGQIEKSHGKGAVMRLGDNVRAPIEVIPTLTTLGRFREAIEAARAD